MRAFVAVRFSDDVRAAVASSAQALCGGDRSFRLISEDNLHLTLQFLGEIEDTQINPAHESLSGGLSAVKSFSVQLAGSGAFPSARRARIVWIGIQAGAKELIDLATTVERSLAEFGWRPDKPFTPHVTVARARGQAQLKNELPVDRVIAVQRVDSIHLMQSVLSKTGAEYHSRAQIRLG